MSLRLSITSLAWIVLSVGLQAGPRASLIASGDFRGVIDAAVAIDPDSSGIFALRVNAAGSFTAHFVWKEESYRARGAFPDGIASASFSVPKVGAPGDTLTVDLMGFGTSVQGTLTETIGGFPNPLLTFDLSGAPPDPTLVAALGTGLLTAFFEPTGAASPEVQGDGFSLTTISKTSQRAARFVGRMPDQEPYSSGAPLRADTYHLRSALYKKKHQPGGQLLGRSTVRNDPAIGNLLAAFRWHRRPSSIPGSFSAGFNNRADIFGFAAYPRGERFPPIGLQTFRDNAKLVFKNGALPSLKEQPVTITIFGARLSSPNELGVRLQVIAPTAQFKGSFLHPATGERIRFAGAFKAAPTIPIIDYGEGRGSFLFIDQADPNNTTSGSVRIIPARAGASASPDSR